MKFTSLPLILLVYLSVSRAAPFSRRNATLAWPEPEPCTGNCTGVHDPSVIRREDGTWFRYSTNGNIAIATAPALTGPWTYRGAMLPSGSVIDVVDDQQLWAPDVFVIDGEYHAYYSVSISGLQTSDIGLATSVTGDVGNWTDHGSVGLPKSSDYNLIDANIFRESESAPIIFNFGSAWGDIYQTTLDDDGGSWSGDDIEQKIFNSTYPPDQDYRAISEGSFEFWWPLNGTNYYYLFFSSGACCQTADDLKAPGEEYKIMVCRSTSATGPFVDQAGKDCLTENGGTLVLGSHGEHVYAPGGQGVYHDPDSDRVALYYHYADPTIGYAYEQFQFGFNYIDLSSGWPVVTA
ncbi:glycoside hydrolase family 43 protein [Lophiostoma macrostomum CBS 122681]|uniref:Arabinan endo-1,5-alpha-L-arabinosidase n=1 Tax=Lophiostoma macrostomum CBS 122681 TaxID=1314788 RepID=A0A6A6SJF9_9PLEO|nr:glycoside hydrolase family 43 protein [Lophiostoma macrostomum CBS 122681]